MSFYCFFFYSLTKLIYEKSLLLAVAMILIVTSSFSQTVVTIGAGTTVSATTDNGNPIYRSSAASAFGWAVSGHVYTASQLASIPNGSTITAVAFNKTSAFGTAVGKTGILKIYMNNSSATSLATTLTRGTIQGYTNVYSNATQSIPATTGFLTFTLATPIIYTGGSLEVYVDWDIASQASSGISTVAFLWQYSTGVASQTIGNSSSTQLTATTALATAQARSYNAQFTYTAPAGCTGTPNNGTSTSTVANACSGVPFSLGLTGGSVGSGLTYQWQSSLAGANTYTNLGASQTSSNFTVSSQTASTDYKVTTTCTGSGLSATSSTITVNQNSFLGCYCTTTPSTGGTGDIITNVTMGTLNNTTTFVAPAYFTSYNNTPVDLAQSSNQNISITFGTDGNQHSAVWIDFNQNGIYDASENVALSTVSAGASATVTYSLVIPSSATLGQTRMRVRGGSDAAYTAAGACTASPYGETEDYLVNIVAPPACLIPTVLTNSSITATSATHSWVAPSPAPAVGYEYAVTTSSTPPASGTATTGLTASSTSLMSNTTYYLHVRSNCGSGFSAWNTSAVFSTLCSAENIPYLMPITGVTTPAIPACTSIENIGNLPNTWISAGAASFGATINAAYTMPVMAYIYNTTNPANDWLYTNGLNLTAGTSYTLKFKYSNDLATTYPEAMKVAYGTAKNAVAMTNVLANYPVISGTTTNDASIVFTPASSGVFYIGFHAYSAADQDVLILDNVEVILTPSCIPVNGLTATATTTNANLAWTAVPTATNGYEYVIDAVATDPTVAGTPVATNSVSVAGTYVFGTTYYAHVRSVCSASNLSTWVNLAFSPTPSCVTGITPAANATNVIFSPNLSISWNAATGAVSYDLYIGTTNPPTTLVTNVTTTTATLTGGASNTLYYWYVVPRNAGGPSTGCASNVTSFTTTAICTPSTTNGGTSGDALLDFVLNGESSTAISVIGAAAIAAPGYIDLTATTTVDLAQGKAYAGNFKVQNGADNLTIWIDYNNNNAFEVSEVVLNNLKPLSASTSSPFSILISPTASVGTHKMRVRDVYNLSTTVATDPCANYSFGESKDFTVNILATGAAYTVSNVGAGACANIAQTTIDAVSNNANVLVPILDANGSIVAQLNANGNALGAITSSVYRNTGAVRQAGVDYYLDRNITITPNTQPTTAVDVRLYYSAAELTALQAVNTLATSVNMTSSKTAAACSNTFSGTSTFLSHVGHGTLGMDYYLDVQPTSFSSFYLKGGTGVLPIAISYFNGSKKSAGNYLDWKVSCSTSPSVSITLERSSDSRSFKAIDEQTATSVRCLQAFDYTDASPLAGINYYRLKVVDQAGVVNYSSIVALLNKEKGFEVISIAPNPVKNQATLTLTSAKAARLQIKVVDFAGKMLSAQNVSVIAGNNLIPFNFETLAAGTYSIIAVNAEGEMKTTRFVKY